MIISYGIHDLYSSPNVIRVIKSKRKRRAERVVRMVENRNTCRILVGNGLYGGSGHNWENNIKIHPM